MISSVVIFPVQDMAEGSSDETQEPVSPLITTTVPAVTGDSAANSPTAETGLVAAVSIQAEGTDHDDDQDASRTTVEVITVPQADNTTAALTPLVLIVEDSIELAEVIQETLQAKQMTTTHFTQGAKALERLSEIDPDVMLLDISLPDMKGWELLESLKLKKTNLPKVIVMTAHGDPANRLIGKLQNVDGYLIKPITPDAIERAVIEVLGGAPR